MCSNVLNTDLSTPPAGFARDDIKKEIHMKIPKNAKRVFKGIIFDVYHWQQKMFDGTSQTFECPKREDNVTILPVDGDKLYYAEEVQSGDAPFTTFFGGKAEEGETPLEAAKRELFEESGMTSDEWELLAVHDSYASKLDWTVYTYVARNAKITGEQHLDPGEKIAVREVTWDRFFDLVTGQTFRNKEWMMDMLLWKFKEPEKLEAFKKKLFG